MDTVAKRLVDWATRLEARVDELLLEHSRIWQWNVNEPGSGVVVITGTPYAWEDLDSDGRNLQTQALEEYGRWRELSRAVLEGSAESIVQDFASAQDHVLAVIDQSAQTHYESIGEARKGVEKRFAEMKRILAPLLKGDGGVPLLVPDTNALLYDPRLEDWEFSEFPEFDLVILPTVLAELDDLKMNYRRESVRDKAEQLIRRIKGYRSRGRLTDGVPLRKGRSTIRAMAVEPRPDTALSWLRWDSADDRILSSVLEIMRTSPARPVVLVTRDLNLQNKAEFATIPYSEPPEL